MLDSGDTGERVRQACTEGCRASAVRREAVLTDHGRIFACAGDQTCCGIQYSLQLISDRLRRLGQD